MRVPSRTTPLGLQTQALEGNLGASDIVGQVLAARRALGDFPRRPNQAPAVSNVRPMRTHLPLSPASTALTPGPPARSCSWARASRCSITALSAPPSARSPTPSGWPSPGYAPAHAHALLRRRLTHAPTPAPRHGVHLRHRAHNPAAGLRARHPPGHIPARAGGRGARPYPQPSLSAPTLTRITAQLRSRIMPINRTYPLRVLMDACHRYNGARPTMPTSTRVGVAGHPAALRRGRCCVGAGRAGQTHHVRVCDAQGALRGRWARRGQWWPALTRVLQGVNDDPALADGLASLVEGLPAHFNLMCVSLTAREEVCQTPIQNASLLTRSPDLALWQSVQPVAGRRVRVQRPRGDRGLQASAGAPRPVCVGAHVARGRHSSRLRAAAQRRGGACGVTPS